MSLPTSVDPVSTSLFPEFKRTNPMLIPYKPKGSISPLSTSPAKYASLLQIIEEEKKIVDSLPAVEFCVDNEDEAVQSSDYFFDALSPLLGKGKTTARPRKFKELTKEAKEDPSIKALKMKKKELQQELVDCSTKRLPGNFTDMIVCSAQKCEPFIVIERHLPEEHATVPLLKSTYMTAVDGSHPFTLPETLSQLVDFDRMTHAEALRRAGYIKAGQEGKIDSAAWDDRKPLIDQLAKHWADEALLFVLSKGATATSLTINAYLTMFLPNVHLMKTGGLFAVMKDKCRPDDLKILNSVIAIIIGEIQESYAKHETKTETALIALRGECSIDPLKNLIEETTLHLLLRQSTLNALAGTPKKAGIFALSSVIKEQKQHSLTRFYNLLNYYTAFVNTIHLLGVAAGEIKPGSQDTVAVVVAKLLENSFLEFDDNPRARSASTPAPSAPTTMSKEAIEKAITIHSQAHREKTVMGWEKAPIADVDKDLAAQTLNLFLAAFSDGKPVRKFERSHTLPFPSCFAWKEDKEREFIQEAGEVFSKAPKSKPVHFNSVVFKKIVGEKIDHKEIEEHFRKVFESYKEQYEEASEFIYMSLETIRRFYLRLFSETEMLPDFINIDLDGVSEWRQANSVETYKRSLALALKGLVEAKSACTQTDVVDALVPYFQETQKKAAKLHQEWTAEKGKSPATLMRLIGLFQIEETLRTALLNRSRHAAITAIFAEAIPVS